MRYKRDSTGICFIGERRFKDFLSTYIPAQPGPMQVIDGEIIGEHDGLMFYTLGQRQGLHIGGVKGADEEPWYVVGKDASTNTLLVAQGANHPALFSRSLRTSQLHFINTMPEFADEFRCSAKTRYRQADQPCSLIRDTNGWRIEFDEPQRSASQH